MDSKLFRPKEGRVIGGVCAGLAQLFNIDPVIIRLVFVLLAISGGSGVIIYIILLIVIPEEEGDSYASHIKTNIDAKDKAKLKEDVKKMAIDVGRAAQKKDSRELFAIILIALGAIFLIQNIWPTLFSFSRYWPLVFVVIGIAILFSGKKKE